MLHHQNAATHYLRCGWAIRLDEDEGMCGEVQSHIEEIGCAAISIALYNHHMLPAQL